MKKLLIFAVVFLSIFVLAAFTGSMIKVDNTNENIMTVDATVIDTNDSFATISYNNKTNTIDNKTTILKDNKTITVSDLNIGDSLIISINNSKVSVAQVVNNN